MKYNIFFNIFDFIENNRFALLQSHLLLCWHGFCDVSATLWNVSVTLSKWILDVQPRYDSTKLAEAVPIAERGSTMEHQQTLGGAIINNEQQQQQCNRLRMANRRGNGVEM